MELSLLNGKQIRVANKDYKLVFVDKIKKGKYLGLTLHSKGEIIISLDQNKESMVDTILHEVMHCIWYTQGLVYSLDATEIEEFIVRSYTTNLLALFKIHPWILDIIKEI